MREQPWQAYLIKLVSEVEFGDFGGTVNDLGKLMNALLALREACSLVVLYGRTKAGPEAALIEFLPAHATARGRKAPSGESLG